MAVNKHPALVVDSKSLQYNIIIGANFLDMCGIQLDYDNYLAQWMEYNIPLHDTIIFFLTATTPLIHTN